MSYVYITDKREEVERIFKELEFTVAPPLEWILSRLSQLSPDYRVTFHPEKEYQKCGFVYELFVYEFELDPNEQIFNIEDFITIVKLAKT